MSPRDVATISRCRLPAPLGQGIAGAAGEDELPVNSVDRAPVQKGRKQRRTWRCARSVVPPEGIWHVRPSRRPTWSAALLTSSPSAEVSVIRAGSSRSTFWCGGSAIFAVTPSGQSQDLYVLKGSRPEGIGLYGDGPVRIIPGEDGAGTLEMSGRGGLSSPAGGLRAEGTNERVLSPLRDLSGCR